MAEGTSSTSSILAEHTPNSATTSASGASTLPSQSLPASQQSRVADHAMIVHPGGADGDVSESGRHANTDTDGVFDVDEEDFVAVDHEDVDDSPWFFRPRVHSKTSELDKLNPYTSLLSLADVEQCMKVEDAFPKPERCTREKVEIPCQSVFDLLPLMFVSNEVRYSIDSRNALNSRWVSCPAHEGPPMKTGQLRHFWRT